LTDFDRQFLEIYAAFIAVLAGLSYCAIRRRVAVGPLMVIAASINLVCLLADWVALQADNSSMVWPIMWLVALLALVACMPGAACLAAIIFAQHWRLSALKRVMLPLIFALLTGAHCFFAMMWLAYISPKA
jgi:hypothetical protein